MDTGDIIQEKLKQKGWSQNQLSHKSGVAQAQISRLVNGQSSNVTVTSLRNLAKAFGCAVVDLLPDEDKLPQQH